MTTADQLRVGDRIRRLIEIIGRLRTFLDGVDWESVIPIIEKIIEAIDSVFGDEVARADTAAFAALSNDDLQQMRAAGFDFAAIVQLIMLIVELLRSLRGENKP